MLEGGGVLANLVSFRDLLKLVSCLFPEFNEIPGRMDCFTFLGTSWILRNFPSREIFFLKIPETVAQHHQGKKGTGIKEIQVPGSLPWGRCFQQSPFGEFGWPFREWRKLIQRPLQPALLLSCLSTSQSNQSRVLSWVAAVPCGGRAVCTEGKPQAMVWSFKQSSVALGFLTRIRKKIHFIYVYMQKPLNFSIK